jgi:hypothetical protein
VKKCYVHLGKYGDIIILLPGWKLEYERTGVKPVVMVDQKFADILEGVSYVEPWAVPYNWYWHTAEAKAKAIEVFGKDAVVFPKWWDDKTYESPKDIPIGAPILVIQNGKREQVKAGQILSYMSSSWRGAGFDPDRMMEPPIFDQRSPAREAVLVKSVFKTAKPKILVALQKSGASSPFPFEPEVYSALRPFRDTCEIINMDVVRAEKPFDLLGLFDLTHALITSDTMQLHLAGACFVNYVAFLQNGGGASLPKGNCHLAVQYADVPKKISEVQSVIANLINRTKV